MKLTILPPFCITARLQPGLKIGDDWISGKILTRRPDGRTVYCFVLDIGKKSYKVKDILSGCSGGSLQEGFRSLLSFLGAAAEGKSYEERTGRESENSKLFDKKIVRWAQQHSDELGSLQCELEENSDLLTEEK